MRNFNVLLTCCGMHVKERIDSLRENEDGAKVKVFACNCNKENLPPVGLADKTFVVPPITDEKYIGTIIQICKDYEVDIIIPTVTLELNFMAANRKKFEDEGIRVSISSLSSLEVANNKIHLQTIYDAYMPKQMVIRAKELCICRRTKATIFFSECLVKGIKPCCKLPDHCGGNGFAIIDDEKALDFSYFNRFAGDMYITEQTFMHAMEKSKSDIILQECIEGKDYSCSVLAVNGRITHIVGYYGYQISHGAIVRGEIAYNKNAYEIAEKIVSELQLDGNICFDFKESEDGTLYLLEINPRVNASLPFVWKAGINMLYLRCKNLLGDYSDIEESFSIQYGLKMRKYHASRYYL